jgi:hypothetical protein
MLPGCALGVDPGSIGVRADEFEPSVIIIKLPIAANAKRKTMMP